MGQKLRTLLPVIGKQLTPQWNYLPEFRSANQKFKDKQKEDYDRRHRTMEMPLILEDSEVWVRRHKGKGGDINTSPKELLN